jgi:hypothetical protein
VAERFFIECRGCVTDQREYAEIAYVVKKTPANVRQIAKRAHQIRDLLAADAVMYSDGGGVVTTARKPIYGRDKIARYVVGVRQKTAYPADPIFARVLVNGDPGLRMGSASKGFLRIIAIEVADGLVQAIRFFANPERFPVEFPKKALPA